MSNQEIPRCVHCDQQMKKWKCPPDSTWGIEFKWVCFNDDCTYYVRGWNWMMDKYQHRSSYRFSIDPNTGEESPIPVWSPTALKKQIIED